MGASESAEIQVSFNRPNLFYFAGEQIAGNIAFQNTHDKLTLDEIFLEFIGELGYTTRETRRRNDSNGRSHTEHYTEYHRIPFLTLRIPVVQPQYGQREVTLYRGQYSWPFEFVLPQCLPPSSVPSTITYPYVKYYTRIVLDKPWYKPNAKQVYALTIFPRVNLHHLHAAQQPVPFSHLNRKKVQVEGYLVQGGVTPGEKLALHLDLQNPKRSEIKRIEVTLYQHRQVAQSHHAEVIFRMDLPNLLEFNGTEFHQTFDLQIPAVQLAPTYTYMPQCCGPSFAIGFHYELKLEVKARGLFTDFKVNIPVIVGTEPTSNQQQLINTFVETNTPSAPAYDYDEPPPSQSNQIFDSCWYKTQLIDTVIPSYNDAYTTLNEKIVQRLLEVNIDSDEKTIRTLIDSLICASQNVQNKLEHKVQESQKSVNQANSNIQHTQEQVKLAEKAVQDKQHALNAAEHDMREAQKAVDRACLCGRRRQKRGFGKWWRKNVEKPFVKIIRQTVVKPVCSVVNAGGIDNAKDRRALAGHNLHDAQQRLVQYQQNLAHQHVQHATASITINLLGH